MKIQDLPVSVQDVISNTMRVLIIDSHNGLNSKTPVQLAHEVRSAFEALYANAPDEAADDGEGMQLVGTPKETVASKLVVEIEPRIVGMEKLEALVDALTDKRHTDKALNEINAHVTAALLPVQPNGEVGWTRPGYPTELLKTLQQILRRLGVPDLL